MMLYLLLFCLILSTTLGQQDGLTELKENTTTVTLTPNNTTLINLEPGSHVLIDFRIKSASAFYFYIDPKECVNQNQTVSTSFIIGGGNWIALKAGFTNESYNNGKVNVTYTNTNEYNMTILLVKQKIEVAVFYKQNNIYFDVNSFQTDINVSEKMRSEFYDLGDLVTFPFYGKDGVQPRVTFFAFNTGECNISYEMPQNDMVPLTADNSYHDVATTITTPSKDESNESWYEGSTFRKIVYAYLWILSCALTFIIGVCAGQRKPRTYRNQVQSIEVGSASV